MSITGAKGEKFIIICIDVFSKWVELGAIKSKSPEVTGEWFYDFILSRYGLCSFVRCDNGNEWHGHFKRLLQSYGIA